MHRPIRRRYLAAGLVTGLSMLVAGILIASQILGATAAPISHSGNTRARSVAGLAPWLYQPSGFAGKVLHWSDRGSFFEAGTSDPSNGKVILSDYWMALDAQGQPTAYHVRYTYPDGQLHQEIYQNATTSVIVRGADYRPSQMVPPGWCITSMQTTSSNLVSEYPLFANTAQLGPIMHMKDLGTQALALTPPATASLPGVAPSAREGTGTTADVWESTQISPIDGSKGTHQLSLGPLGRVVASTTTGLNKDGSIVVDAWSVYGPLDVYTRSDVPSIIFAVPQDLGKECAG